MYCSLQVDISHGVAEAVDRILLGVVYVLVSAGAVRFFFSIVLVHKIYFKRSTKNLFLLLDKSSGQKPKVSLPIRLKFAIF